jgi:hypothetical protein
MDIWYLAHCLENEAYRRRLHDRLRKGEQLHALRRHLFFGHEGQLRQRQPEDQTTQAGSLNLVTNAVVCWNTVYLSAAVEQFRREGSHVAEEDLVHLSPARSAHLNPYGRYDFDLGATYDATELRPLLQPASP